MRSLVLILSLFLLLAACDRGDETQYSADVKKIAKTFGLYPSFARQVSRADSITLYEGLPHPASANEAYTKELDAKSTTNFGGYSFYSERLPLTASDAEALRQLYCDESSFRPFSGIEACGGYHPDYCIEWVVGKDKFLVQICFGCHEMKTFSDGKEIYCDITRAAFPKFESLLKKYRKNRPPSPN